MIWDLNNRIREPEPLLFQFDHIELLKGLYRLTARGLPAAAKKNIPKRYSLQQVI